VLLTGGIGYIVAQREATGLYTQCMLSEGWEDNEARDARAMRYVADLDACEGEANGAADFAMPGTPGPFATEWCRQPRPATQG